MFPLPIFPEGALASSVITTVWVGVLVLCFFNLRFGWVLSGLVVPGYVVPLMIVKPLAAAVILVEAILAYLIVWVFSEKLAHGRYPSLFGRDRFMGLILASIAVRLAMDGWALPHLADWLADNFNRQLDWQSDLQSFGLVIISLLANQFWKPGLSRGLFATAVVTGLTFVIVRYGLMELTNFRMSGVTYLYEGLASSVLASPKAYMILVLTALYASHMNVRYGWDFSGILIPALIALQWYQPTKIVTSFVEAAAIYLIARQLLKTPWLAGVTMEGANKILLFFNISFVLKLIVGHALVWLALDVKTTDFYGFGYLLSTLLAIKAHDKDIFPRLMRSTLQVSLIGAGLGNLAGLALAAIVPSSAANAAPAGARAGGRVNDMVVQVIGAASLQVATGGGGLSGEEAAALAHSVAILEAGLPPLQAGANAAADGWRIETLGDKRVALARAGGEGADLLLFDGAARRDLAIVVEQPETPGLALAARELQRRLEARWLLLGSSVATGQGGSPAVDAFRRAHSGLELVIARNGDDDGGSSKLMLSDRAASGLELKSLRAAVSDLRLGIATSRESASGQENAPALLSLSPNSLNEILKRDEVNLSGSKTCALPTYSVKRTPDLTLAQRLYLRDQVVDPLLDVEPGNSIDLTIPARAAGLAGFVVHRCDDAGRTLFVLQGPQGAGTFFIDPAGRRDRIVISALREERRGGGGLDTLADIGFAIARASDAALFALAPRELAYDSEQQTMFGVVLQTALDRVGDQPALVLQLRSRPDVDPGIADGRAIVTMDRLGTPGALAAEVLAVARAAGLDPVLARRTRDVAGFEAYPQTALLYLGHSQGKRYAVIYAPAADD